MYVWNVLHAARWNTGRKKSPKICHLRTMAQLCRAVSLQLRHVSTIGKKLVKQQYLLHVFSQYGELRPTNGWHWFGCLGHPSKFQRVSRLAFVTAGDVTHRRPTIPCTMFGRLLSWYTIYTLFGGSSCLLREFCQLQSSLCVQVLHSPILATLLHGTRVVGVSQTLRRWAEGATYIRQDGHHVGHWPTFWFLF